MFDGIDIWGFLAGLGLFLLGMFMLEQGLRGLATRSMKRLLLQHTRTPIRGVFTGTLTTSILQSSSLVGLLVLAFVGAGILELRNALGIIIGSNLGTTFTGWIVTIIGFKLDMAILANPLLAMGAITTVFLKSDSKPYFYGNLMLGIGLLLMGIAEMSGGFISLADNVEVTDFQGHNIFVYFIAGVLFTAVIQSSSASMMIVLSALHAGVLTLHEAAPIVVGADLGTTSTVLLGALKGTVEKRRVALSHFLYNLITALIALLLIPVLIYIISDVLLINDPLYSVVMFHTLFNILGIFLFIPFIDYFILFLHRLVPTQHFVGELGSNIRPVPPSVTDAAIEAVRKELFSLIIHSIKMNLRCFKINPSHIFPQKLDGHLIQHNLYEDDYSLLKRASGEMLGYTYSVQGGANEQEDLRQLTHLNHAIRNVSYATKYIKDIRNNLAEFRHSESALIQSFQTEFSSWFKSINQQLIILLINQHPETQLENSRQFTNELRKRYEKNQLEIYHASGQEKIYDEETLTLVNVNRAIFRSTSNLLETLQVLNAENSGITVESHELPAS
jgi:phosphate:Na+ symporter